MPGTCELVSLTEKFEDRNLFLRRHFEEVGHVAFRHYEDMTPTERMVVRAHIGQRVFGQDRPRSTELALFSSFHRSLFVLPNDRVERPGTMHVT
jgi:hypothetical protein